MISQESPAPETIAEAVALLAEIHQIPLKHFNTERHSLLFCYRRARYLAHPSRNDGSTALLNRVNEAGDVLGLTVKAGA